MNRSYKTAAIILKRNNWGEADRLVTVLSQDLGKLRLLAKGIRRLNSRKKGHLEPLVCAQLQIVKGKSLDLVIEAATLHNFPVLRQNLNRVRIAYLFVELVDKLTAENQENELVYDLLLNYLTQLNSLEVEADLIQKFEMALLTSLGFGLPVKHDRTSLEAHILTITERPLISKKLK